MRTDEGPPVYRTRELSPQTWKDFELLFEKYGGVQDGCWCMYYHRDRPNRGIPDAERHAQNRSDHERLVREGKGRGVLVYEAGTAVGWCQFGKSPDLPRIDAGRKYRAFSTGLHPPPTWRITCFFVDRPHRRRGVMGVALAGALRAIAASGGGIVEAYPSTDPRAVATWFGAVSTFHAHGFVTVAAFGRSNVLVRKRVRSLARRARRSRER